MVPDFHQLLARAAGIDPYSYLYEVLESHEIEFSDATGVAARSCRDGRFDWTRFEQDAAEARDWLVVGAVAQPIMTTRDLEEPSTARALADKGLMIDLDPSTACMGEYRVFANVYETLTRYNMPGSAEQVAHGSFDHSAISAPASVRESTTSTSG